MTPTIIFILFAVLAAIALFGLVTRVLEGAPAAWRMIRETYPAHAPDAGPGAKEMRVLVRDSIDPTRPSRPKMLTVRYTIDDDSLHAWPVSIRGGAAMGVSIPWAIADLSDPVATPMGPHVSMFVDGAELLVPAAAIESELATRAELHASADPMVEVIDRE